MSGLPYREEQPAVLLRIALGSTILLCLGLAIALPLAAAARGAFVAVAVLEAGLLALLWSYRVEVSREALHVRFGPGLLGRSYPLARVREAAVARTLSAGLRVRMKTVTWSAKPGGAVELLLDDGWRVRIGSEKPERLLAAIEAARAIIGR